MLRACERSLRRLGTDYLDLYLIHQVDDAYPLEETIRALDRLADEKLVRHIGVSNFAVARLERRGPAPATRSRRIRFTTISRCAKRNVPA